MTVSITHRGTHYDLDYGELGVTDQNTDGEILERVAYYLDAPVTDLQKLQVLRLESGDVSIQPYATYG